MAILLFVLRFVLLDVVILLPTYHADRLTIAFDIGTGILVP